MIRPRDSGQWAELCASFDALVNLDPDARAQRLVAIGASDPAARDALETLLEADANAASRLNRLDTLFDSTGQQRSDRDDTADGDILISHALNEKICRSEM